MFLQCSSISVFTDAYGFSEKMFPVQSQPPLHQYRLVIALLGGYCEKVSFPVVKSPERFVRVTMSIVLYLYCLLPPGHTLGFSRTPRLNPLASSLSISFIALTSSSILLLSTWYIEFCCSYGLSDMIQFFSSEGQKAEQTHIISSYSFSSDDISMVLISLAFLFPFVFDGAGAASGVSGTALCGNLSLHPPSNLFSGAISDFSALSAIFFSTSWTASAATATRLRTSVSSFSASEC